MLPPLPFLLFQEASIILFDGFRTGMIRSKGPLIDDNGTLEERLSLLVIALAPVTGKLSYKMKKIKPSTTSCNQMLAIRKKFAAIEISLSVKCSNTFAIMNIPDLESQI